MVELSICPYPLEMGLASHVLKRFMSLLLEDVRGSFYREPCVCVCNPWNHRDPFGFCFTAGGPGILLLTWSDQARQQDGILELATPAYLRFFSNGTRLSPEPQTADMHDTSSLRPARRPRSCALGHLSGTLGRAGVWHRFQFSTPYPKCVWPCANPG